MHTPCIHITDPRVAVTYIFHSAFLLLMSDSSREGVWTDLSALCHTCDIVRKCYRIHGKAFTQARKDIPHCPKIKGRNASRPSKMHQLIPMLKNESGQGIVSGGLAPVHRL